MDAAIDIKQRLGVEEVVGKYVELKRAGRNLKGLCPFHNERTPSFIVSPDKNIYHCFGCNAGGDIFEFVMKMDGMDFREALERLASQAGVDLSKYERGPSNAKLKQRLRNTLDLATKFYQVNLSKNQKAIEYVFKDRKISKDTALEFKIGYAPNRTDSLLAFFKNKNIDMDDAQKAGLVNKRSRDLRDVFRGRIMIPLADKQGNTVGFTARLLDESVKAPKYVNTAQTLLYDKSQHVFGYHLAKDDIRKKDVAVIVEGNMDVISSHQAGIRNVIATAGTAMTKDHLRQISRLTSNAALAFDQDSAGINATLRSIPIAQSMGVNLHIVDIPEGKDPDELIQKSPDKWQKAIDNSKYVIDWLFNYHESQFDIKSARGKSQFSEALLAVISQLVDPVEQEHYMSLLAKKTDVSFDAVKRKMANIQEKQKTPILKRAAVNGDKDEKQLLEDTFLSLVLRYPEARVALGDINLEWFGDEKRRKTAEAIKGLGKQRIDEKFPDELKEYGDFVKILVLKAEELFGSWESADRSVEALDLAQRLRMNSKTKIKQNLSDAIRQAETEGDEKSVEKLLKQYQAVLKEE